MQNVTKESNCITNETTALKRIRGGSADLSNFGNG